LRGKGGERLKKKKKTEAVRVEERGQGLSTNHRAREEKIIKKRGEKRTRNRGKNAIISRGPPR